MVYSEGRNVIRWLVDWGHAWEYDRYSDDPTLGHLEREAAYLRRQGLPGLGEAPRIAATAFEPEALSVPPPRGCRLPVGKLAGT